MRTPSLLWAATTVSFTLCMAAASGCGSGTPESRPAAAESTPAAAAAQAPEPNRGSTGPTLTGERPPSENSPAAEPAAETVTIVGTGDILFHQRVLRVVDRHADGYDVLFRRISASIPPEAIAFANLESPLVRDVRTLDSTMPPTLGADPAAAIALRRAGFDILGLGNNHAYDQASSGLKRTLEAVRAADIIPVGAGETLDQARDFAIVEHENGQRVAFLSYARHINQGPGSTRVAHIATFGDEVAMLDAVRRARAAADLVVMATHWGADFVGEPRPTHRRLAARLVDAGVDLILGSGPHILHEVVELPSPRGRAIVAYSLGNFVSNQGLRYRIGEPDRRMVVRATQDGLGRDGALLFVEFEIGMEGRITPRSVEAIPLWVHNNYLAWHGRLEPEQEIYVTPLVDASPEAREERLPFIRASLGPRVTLRFAEGTEGRPVNIATSD